MALRCIVLQQEEESSLLVVVVLSECQVFHEIDLQGHKIQAECFMRVDCEDTKHMLKSVSLHWVAKITKYKLNKCFMILDCEDTNYKINKYFMKLNCEDTQKQILNSYSMSGEK